ncbi:hypothetical protein MKX03_032034, partial [Papaver bracteatum]
FDMNVIAHPNLVLALDPGYKKVNPKGKPTANSAWDDTKRLSSRHENVDKQYEKEYKETEIPTKDYRGGVQSQLTTTTRISVSSDRQFVDKNYFQYFPVHIIPFVTSTEEVSKVGNCGFEVVEKQLNLGSQATRLRISGSQYVREKMLKNMDIYQALYITMWGQKGYNDMVKRITVPQNMTKVSTDNWMLMPECGFIIAETFSTVMHYIGKGMSYTFAPTTVKMVTKIKNRKVVMGFVEGNHFIGLKLSGNCPLPPEPSLGYWKDVKNHVVEEWLA